MTIGLEKTKHIRMRWFLEVDKHKLPRSTCLAHLFPLSLHDYRFSSNSILLYVTTDLAVDAEGLRCITQPLQRCGRAELFSDRSDDRLGALAGLLQRRRTLRHLSETFVALPRFNQLVRFHTLVGTFFVGYFLPGRAKNDLQK